MKKSICICFMIFLLSGCMHSKGSFHEGNRDMDYLYEDICDNIENGSFKMEMLDDTWWSKAKIEKLYALDMTKIQESYVKSCAMEAAFTEIAFFKVDKENEQVVKEAIQYRITSLKKRWQTYITDSDKILNNVKQGRIGRYYYMIIGEDSKKVVNYIRTMK